MRVNGNFKCRTFKARQTSTPLNEHKADKSLPSFENISTVGVTKDNNLENFFTSNTDSPLEPKPKFKKMKDKKIRYHTRKSTVVQKIRVYKVRDDTPVILMQPVRAHRSKLRAPKIKQIPKRKTESKSSETSKNCDTSSIISSLMNKFSNKISDNNSITTESDFNDENTSFPNINLVNETSMGYLTKSMPSLTEAGENNNNNTSSKTFYNSIFMKDKSQSNDIIFETGSNVYKLDTKKDSKVKKDIFIKMPDLQKNIKLLKETFKLPDNTKNCNDKVNCVSESRGHKSDIQNKSKTVSVSDGLFRKPLPVKNVKIKEIKEKNVHPAIKKKSQFKKVQLLNTPISYPSTSTPFESPEVASEILTTVLFENLSPLKKYRVEHGTKNYPSDDLLPRSVKSSVSNSTRRNSSGRWEDFTKSSKQSLCIQGRYKSSLESRNANTKSCHSKIELFKTPPTVDKNVPIDDILIMRYKSLKELEHGKKVKKETKSLKKISEKEAKKRERAERKKKRESKKWLKSKKLQELGNHFEEVSGWPLCVKKTEKKCYFNYCSNHMFF